MCILSYAPTNDGFVLNFNIDEVYNRTAKPPEQYTIDNQKLLLPKDIESGGSWIGVECNKVCCWVHTKRKGGNTKSSIKKQGKYFY